MKQNGISVVSLAVAAMVGGAISYVVVGYGSSSSAPMAAPVSASVASGKACAYASTWVGGFRRVRPLLSSEPECESQRFMGLRGSIGTTVDQMKADGRLTSASVYVREFQKGEWTGYNADERYDPGSMMKIPILLTYLAMKEETPDILGRVFTCETSDLAAPPQSFVPREQAQPGTAYSLARLLELMIVHSDNRATAVLLRHVPPGRYVRTYTDLGLPAPQQHAGVYLSSVREFSVFMKALYNSSLLSPINSGYALELMTRSEFRLGLLAGLPADVEAAHKFGESVDQNGHQLHETALVYAGGQPYLITVMTRGSDRALLPAVLAELSELVYRRITGDQAGRKPLAALAPWDHRPSLGTMLCGA